MDALALKNFDPAPDMTQVNLPEPVEGEVRVRMHAASVNGLLKKLGTTHTMDYRDDIAAQVLAISPQGIDAALHFAGAV